MRGALLKQIASRQARVAVVGLGYVGLPLALRLSELGFPVTGVDSAEDRLRLLRQGESPISTVASEDVRGQPTITYTPAVGQSDDCDVVILCVPTPLGEHREPDLAALERAGASLRGVLRPGQLIVLESTSYPGTTEELLRPALESSGLHVGTDLFLAFSPERQDPGNPQYHLANTPKLLAGCTPACLELALALYRQVVETVVPMSSPRAAEMAKLVENVYRAVNIGLVNEMKVLADAMELDIWEVLEAAATKPFGYAPFWPGPGLGGHCIPVDPFYLTWKAREFGLRTPLVDAAGETNMGMPHWVLDKVVRALNQAGRPVQEASILVLGVAYKPNVDDTRESPALELMRLLKGRGAVLTYHDPHVPQLPGWGLHSVPLTESVVAGQDLVLLVTDHDGVDYPMVGRHARLMVDTRGRFRGRQAHVIRA